MRASAQTWPLGERPVAGDGKNAYLTPETKNFTMKAVLIDRYGSNDAVKVAEIAVPVTGPMDLLVRVRAASVNPVDVKTREGQLKALLKYRFPLVLGNDLSGVVSDVGALVGVEGKEHDHAFGGCGRCCNYVGGGIRG